MRAGVKEFLKDKKAVVYFDDVNYGFLFDSSLGARSAFSFVNEKISLSDVGITERAFNLLYNKYKSTGEMVYVYVGDTLKMDSFKTLEELKEGHSKIHDSKVKV